MENKFGCIFDNAFGSFGSVPVETESEALYDVKVRITDAEVCENVSYLCGGIDGYEFEIGDSEEAKYGEDYEYQMFLFPFFFSFSVCHTYCLCDPPLLESRYKFKNLHLLDMVLIAPQLDVDLFKQFQTFHSKYEKSNKCEWCVKYSKANSDYPKNSDLSTHEQKFNKCVRVANRKAVACIADVDWDWVLAVFSKEYRFIPLPHCVSFFFFFCAR